MALPEDVRMKLELAIENLRLELASLPADEAAIRVIRLGVEQEMTFLETLPGDSEPEDEAAEQVSIREAITRNRANAERSRTQALKAEAEGRSREVAAALAAAAAAFDEFADTYELLSSPRGDA